MLQILLGRIRDGVQHEVKTAPFPREPCENGFKLSRLPYVARQHERLVQLAGKRLHVRLGRLIKIGDGQCRTVVMQGFGASIRIAMFIRDTDH